MEPSRWERVEELYHAAAQQAPADRDEFLARACAGDPGLRREVEELLSHDDSTEGMLDVPAWQQASGVLASAQLKSGSLLGPYRVIRRLGAGGMGSVYLAEDTRLRRQVAVKLLRGRAATHNSHQRLQREAQLISSLSHPHICALYDIGSQDGTPFLVMEHVEGETLGSRLRKGALPLEAAMRIGAQIADALAAAHAKGIVHRDLKPENIMLTPTGVKVLDFGLAKLTVESRQTSTDQSSLTAEGMIVGTPAYMAPEQLEGRDCGGRTDIFALGLVLYEMITGRRAFAHETKAGLIAAIMTAEPAFAAIGNPQMERIVRGCLEKESGQRWQNALDIKRLLEWPASPSIAGPASPRRTRLWRWAAAGAVLLTGALVAGYLLYRPQPEPEVKFTAILSGLDSVRAGSEPKISPDGSRIAYIARNASGNTEMWIHDLRRDKSAALAGTEGADVPFWSGDGQWIGFWADGKLRKIRPSGGRPQTIVEIGRPLRPAWNRSGDIIFPGHNRMPLFHVRDSGGTPRQITQLDAGRTENSHRFPSFLPDGRRFLFLARCSDRESNALYIGSLDSSSVIRVANIQSNTEYVPAVNGKPGLLYVRDGSLVLQQFEGRLIGEPAPVVETVRYIAPSAHAAFGASADGRVLIYSRASSDYVSLTWFDRAGNRLGKLGTDGDYGQPRISPDGSRVLFNRSDNRAGNRDLWIMHIASGTAARLTTSPANDWRAVWSPDGQQVLFGSDRQRGAGMKPYVKIVFDAGVGEEPLATNAPLEEMSPASWSRTGWMAFTGHRTIASKSDIWIAHSEHPNKPFALMATEATELEPRFSPDGKWIAYVSDETGRSEVYVRAFHGAPAGSERRIQVSAGGGDFPVWAPNSSELLYVSMDLKLNAVAVQGMTGTGIPSSTPLFRLCPEAGPASRPGNGTSYETAFDVAPDGRILVRCLAEPPGRVVVWMNWRGHQPQPVP